MNLILRRGIPFPGQRLFLNIYNKLPDQFRGPFLMAVQLRILLLAHAYTPVFSLAILLPAQWAFHRGAGFGTPTVALAYAVGSFGFVITKYFGGSYADLNGRSAALVFGISLMAGSTLGLGAIEFLMYLKLISPLTCLILAGVLQVPVGAGLAFIEGTDRDILRLSIEECQAGAFKTVENDARDLDWILRTSGIAAGAFIGALLFAAVQLLQHHSAIESQATTSSPGLLSLAGPIAPGCATVFVATSLLQLLALRKVFQLRDRVPAISHKTAIADADEIPRLIREHLRSDETLRGLVLLASVVDGWLMFLVYRLLIDFT